MKDIRDMETDAARYRSLVHAYRLALGLDDADDTDRAAGDVLAERRRQVDVEGWTRAHDDQHVDGSIGDAAAAFLIHGRVPPDTLRLVWPGIEPGKHDRRRQLVIGAALAIAEIERLDRLAATDDLVTINVDPELPL